MTHVEEDICPQEAEVPPMLGVEDVETALEEFVCRTRSAVGAHIGNVAIHDVAPGNADEGIKVLATCLACWRGDGHVFHVGACNLIAPNSYW